MIARLWRGIVPAEKVAEYREYQLEIGPPAYRATAGNRGVWVLGRELGDRYEIAMLTLWDDWESIRRFAGDPVDRARYFDRDFDFLIDPPEEVEHFELLAHAPATAGGPTPESPGSSGEQPVDREAEAR